MGLLDWGRNRGCSTGALAAHHPGEPRARDNAGVVVGGLCRGPAVCPAWGSFAHPRATRCWRASGLRSWPARGSTAQSRPRRYRAGVTLAAVLGIGATVFGLVTSGGCAGSGLRRGLGGLPFGVGEAALTWVVGLASVAAWRAGKVGPWLPALVTAAELGALYYLGFTVWGWAIPLPRASPVLSSVAADGHVGRIGGVVFNLPVTAGMTTGDPYVGMTLAPMNQVLRAVQDRRCAP